MLRHISGVFARRRMLSDSLRECAYMMRAGAAAHAKVANTQVEGLLAELRDLIAIASERIEGHREGPRAFSEVPVRVAQGLKRRLVFAGAVGDGKRRHVNRSEERRVGKECRVLCRSRWSADH